jgi:hypothetical protein
VLPRGCGLDTFPSAGFQFCPCGRSLVPLLMFAAFGSIHIALISRLVAGILLHDEHQQFKAENRLREYGPR